LDTDIVDEVIGITANFYSLLMLSSPLTTFFQIIKSSSALSISLSLSFAQLMNCLLWVSYGLAVADPFVYGINGFGLLVALISISLRVIYWRSDRALLAKQDLESSREALSEDTILRDNAISPSPKGSPASKRSLQTIDS